MPRRVHVICFGNRFHGDDGFGIHVLERLRRLPLPEGVALFEGGTAGLAALGQLEGCDKAVLVDARRSEHRIGELSRLMPSDLESPADEPALHGFGIEHLLRAATAVRTLPGEVVIVCVGVALPRPFAESLSPEIAAAVEPAATMVLAEL